MTESETFVLSRSGQAPLKFRGTLLAEEEGQWSASREQNRWHDLAVYRTVSGKYVLAIAYHTRFQGEEDFALAQILDAPQAVSEALRTYDPTVPVRGFPLGEPYQERQQRLLDDIRMRYQAQVSRLLDGDFAEEVE